MLLGKFEFYVNLEDMDLLKTYYISASHIHFGQKNMYLCKECTFLSSKVGRHGFDISIKRVGEGWTENDFDITFKKSSYISKMIDDINKLDAEFGKEPKNYENPDPIFKRMTQKIETEFLERKKESGHELIIFKIPKDEIGSTPTDN